MDYEGRERARGSRNRTLKAGMDEHLTSATVHNTTGPQARGKSIFEAL